MAPGCFTPQPDFAPHSPALYCKLEDIPLPATPAPPHLLDTVDSFEVLEQTIFKQKRLSRAKRAKDMHGLLRKVLLKQTFDLVCTIMDRENGFSECGEDDAAPANDDNNNSSNDIELELSPVRTDELELDTCKADSSCSGPPPLPSPSQIENVPRRRRPSRFSDGPPVCASPSSSSSCDPLVESAAQSGAVKIGPGAVSISAQSSPAVAQPGCVASSTNARHCFISDLAEHELLLEQTTQQNGIRNEEEDASVVSSKPIQFEITLQVDDAFFQRSLDHQFDTCSSKADFIRFEYSSSASKRVASSDDDDSEDEDSYEVEIRRLPANKPSKRPASGSEQQRPGQRSSRRGHNDAQANKRRRVC